MHDLAIRCSDNASASALLPPLPASVPLARDGGIYGPRQGEGGWGGEVCGSRFERLTPMPPAPLSLAGEGGEELPLPLTSFRTTATSFRITATSFRITATSFRITATSFRTTATSFRTTAASFRTGAGPAGARRHGASSPFDAYAPAGKLLSATS